ncbi:hypothetical protein [Qipengyuania gelatinilytica]|uniref:DUF3552 domain-containing protein n=1 Tax=Qipengyuania gelatinilytica TaxID=2867231 RepID=A0ABX9A4M0_9SPHN|nr:hypothetical protein [Qipengyuania gelatinilytica]QZD96221.1 hypothetical protein K3136_05895 [Qipengyuania gelatinilytica]
MDHQSLAYILTATASLGGVGVVLRWFLKSGINDVLEQERKERAEENAAQSERLMVTDNRLEKLERDLGHHKDNAKQESLAFKKRFDKIDEVLSELSKSYAKNASHLERFIDVAKIENKMKLDALDRVEKKLGDQDAAHRQWIEQITKSLREVTTRKAD